MEQVETGCKHRDHSGINLCALVVFPAADGRSHPRPSDLLHEETQVVCAEEQEDRLQASQVNGKQTHPYLGLKPTREGRVQRPHNARLTVDHMDKEQLTNTHMPF